MQIVKDLYQGWDTLDETIDFFLNLCLELQALKRLPDPPTELFVHVKTDPQLSDEQYDSITVTLENLD